MAIPNAQFVVSPNMQDYFVDKDTGLPLAGGFVYFYDDVNRNVLSTIYELSGSPGNYTFIPTTNPVNLSAVGTMIDDDNNDINIYLNPYDADGNVSLYFVRVTNYLGVEQFTRAAWPPQQFSIDEQITAQTIEGNFVPNGQFLINSSIAFNADNPVTELNTLENGVNEIAAGAWTIERSLSSTDTYFFQSFGGYIASPPNSPKNYLQFICSAAVAGDDKFIGLKFPDVNKFASDLQSYTFAFWIRTSGATYEIDINVYKFFGSGGSSPEQFQIGTTLTVTNNWTLQLITFQFGSNTGFNIGINDDDYVQLQFSLPNQSLEFELTDVALYQGLLALTEQNSFSTETNAKMISEAVFGSLPTPLTDGSYLYLTPVYTQKGMIFDDSSIGNIIFSSLINVPTNTNLLPCDGSIYPVAGYSDLGIPYSRLFYTCLFNVVNNFNVPIYGTGSTYLTAHIKNTIQDTLRINTNQEGPQTATSDGTLGTGFTFNTLHTGQNSIGMNCVIQNLGGLVDFLAKEGGAVSSDASGGTAGFTVSTIFNEPGDGVPQLAPLQEFTVTPIISDLGGDFFEFRARVSAADVRRYVWFTYNGTGSDPGGGGLGVRINIFSDFTNKELAAVICDSCNGYQVSQIQCVAASSISGGAYFTIFANSITYVVWYIVDGVGTEPSVSNAYFIPVSLNGSDSAIQVATKTKIQINSQFFATPDMRGYSIRILDGGAGRDTNFRGSPVNSDFVLSETIGSIQNSELENHHHPGSTVDINGYLSNALAPPVPGIQFKDDFEDSGPNQRNQVFSLVTSDQGLSETTIKNFCVNAFIRY